MWRRDALVVGSAFMTVAGIATGQAWAALVTAVGGWVLLRAAMRAPTPVAYRTVNAAGAVAALVVAVGDVILTNPQAAFLFHVRREVRWLPLSPGVEVGRGALLAGCLYVYLRVRSRAGLVVASCGAAAVAFILGLLSEWAGSASGMWVWNAPYMPDWQLRSAWMFVPVAWSAVFLVSGYHLMRFHSRVPERLYPFAVGVRCGTAYVGLLIVSYGFLVRVFGKVGLG